MPQQSGRVQVREHGMRVGSPPLPHLGAVLAQAACVGKGSGEQEGEGGKRRRCRQAGGAVGVGHVERACGRCVGKR